MGGDSQHGWTGVADLRYIHVFVSQNMLLDVYVCICLYLVVSVCICLYLVVSGRICLYLVVSACICLYLSFSTTGSIWFLKDKYVKNNSLTNK